MKCKSWCRLIVVLLIAAGSTILPTALAAELRSAAVIEMVKETETATFAPLLAPIIDRTPTPEPTATPAPTVTPAPAPFVPSKCELSQAPTGIRISWQQPAGAKECKIYRRENQGEWLLLDTAPVNMRGYWDTDIEPDVTYSYAVRFVFEDKQCKMSDGASITWTEHSQLSNLKIWQDEDFPRHLHAAWDDVVDAEYDVKVLFEGAYIKDESWRWSGVTYDTKEMEFEYAIPNTTYRFIVTEPMTGQILEKTFKTSNAKKYSQYGARSKGAKLMWVPYDEEGNVWERDNRAYSPVTSKEFHAMLKDYALYFVSNFTYTKKSDTHDVEELFVLRGPNGVVSYMSSWDMTISGAPANQGWNWWSEVPHVYDYEYDWRVNELQPGIYTLEQYFNDELVNNCQFKIKK